MHGMAPTNYSETLNRKWLVAIRVESDKGFYYRGMASFDSKREAKRFVRNHSLGILMRVIEQ